MLGCIIFKATNGQWGFLLKSSSVHNVESTDGDLSKTNINWLIRSELNQKQVNFS